MRLPAAHLQPVQARNRDLPAGISVYLCDLAALPWDLEQCRALLPPDPAPRPEPLRPIAHLRRLQTRALMHHLLAEQLGLLPQQIAPRPTAKGKPELAGLAFNTSHSGDWALLALGPPMGLGVDLEVARPRGQLTELAGYCLQEREVTLWNQASNPGQHEMFYRMWTAKEAALKAWGRGLDQLSQVCLDDPRQPTTATLATESICRIHTLELPAGLVGAVAAK